MGIVVIAQRFVVTRQGQVLEQREGTDEVENLWAWKDHRTNAERLKGRREVVK
jgi:hypothetical protein